MAYATGDIPQTIALFKEVIRHDPYVIAAWNTLGSVYEEQGNEEGARQMRFFAAHVEDEAETWKELATEFRQRGQIHQCVHCLRKALARDPADVGVLFELASIYRLQKHGTKVGGFPLHSLLIVPSSYFLTTCPSRLPLTLGGRRIQENPTTTRSINTRLHIPIPIPPSPPRINPTCLPRLDLFQNSIRLAYSPRYPREPRKQHDPLPCRVPRGRSDGTG